MVSRVKYVTRDNEALLAMLHRNIESISPKDSGRFGSSKIDTLTGNYLGKIVLYLEKSGYCCYIIFIMNLIHDSSNLLHYKSYLYPTCVMLKSLLRSNYKYE